MFSRSEHDRFEPKAEGHSDSGTQNGCGLDFSRARKLFAIEGFRRGLRPVGQTLRFWGNSGGDSVMAGWRVVYGSLGRWGAGGRAFRAEVGQPASLCRPGMNNGGGPPAKSPGVLFVGWCSGICGPWNGGGGGGSFRQAAQRPGCPGKRGGKRAGGRGRRGEGGRDVFPADGGGPVDGDCRDRTLRGDLE